MQIDTSSRHWSLGDEDSI